MSPTTPYDGARAHRKEHPLAATIRFINPEGLVRSPAYTQVVEVAAPGRTVYISGQLGTAPDGKLANRDFRAQAEQVFANLATALRHRQDRQLPGGHCASADPARGAGAPSQSDGPAGQHHDRSLRLCARRRIAGGRGHRGRTGSGRAAAERETGARCPRRRRPERQGCATKRKVMSPNTGTSTMPDHSMKPKKLGILTPRSTAMA